MHVIDRRNNPKSKSLGNRQRFVRRVKSHIREAVKQAIQNRKQAGKLALVKAAGDVVSHVIDLLSEQLRRTTVPPRRKPNASSDGMITIISDVEANMHCIMIDLAAKTDSHQS